MDCEYFDEKFGMMISQDHFHPCVLSHDDVVGLFEELPFVNLGQPCSSPCWALMVHPLERCFQRPCYLFIQIFHLFWSLEITPYSRVLY